MSTFAVRSEEHTSELQSHSDLVCRLLLEKKKTHRQDSERTLSDQGKLGPHHLGPQLAHLTEGDKWVLDALVDDDETRRSPQRVLRGPAPLQLAGTATEPRRTGRD